MNCLRYEIRSPLGMLTAAADDKRICGLWFEGQRYYEGRYAGQLRNGQGSPCIRLLKQWLDRYFAGENPDPKQLPLMPEGTNFQRLIWLLLLEIPYGSTVTYGDIARRAAERSGKSTSSRAVGTAVGRNPISIVIPCHRVIGANGSLTGYAGGLERKKSLLMLERNGCLDK